MLGHGGNTISNHAGAQGISLTLLSRSHMEPSTMLFFPTLLTQQSLLLTSYLCIHLGKDFLDFVPKLRPCHCQTWCCVRQNHQTIPNSILAARQIGQGIWGSSAVQSLTSLNAQKIYYENFFTFQPLSLESVPSSIVPNSNFSKGPSLHLSDPFTPVLGSLHSATDNLSGCLRPRSPNYKLCWCSVVRNRQTPAQENSLQEISSIDKGCLQRKVWQLVCTGSNVLPWPCGGTPCVIDVQSLSHAQLHDPWTAVHQAPLSFTTSLSSLKFMSIKSVMLSNHLILCRPLFLLPSIFPSIHVEPRKTRGIWSGISGRVEDTWDCIRFKGNLEGILNPFKLKPPGKYFRDTRFHF